MRKHCTTEVGLLAIWDSTSLAYIDDSKKYAENFVRDEDIVKCMNTGNIIVWATGGDGTFAVEIRINPAVAITEEERKLVVSHESNLTLITHPGKLCFGSPEGVGVFETELLHKNSIHCLETKTARQYLVDLYFLYEEVENPEKDRTGYRVVLNEVPPSAITPIIQLPYLG